MKKWVSVAAALAAVLVLLGVMHLLKAPAPEPVETQTQPETTVQPMRVLLDTQGQAPELVTIAVDGETVSYAPDGEGYAAVNYDDRLAFDQEGLGRLFTSLMRLVSRKTIDEAPESLSVYGMDEPVSVVTARYRDGSHHEVRVGARSPLEDGYYGMLDDDPAIYLLPTYDVESFLKKRADYRAYSLFHEFGDDAENYALSVRELLIDRGDEGRTRFLRPADGADGQVYGIEIHEPVRVAGDEYAFCQQVIKPLFSLKRARLELAEDLPNDLSRYGLDAPATLFVKDDNGKTRLLIGTEQNGRTYLMREGVPAVLSVKSSALAFLALDYAQVMDRLVWLYPITEVDSLTVERAGRTDVLEVRSGAGFWFNGARVEDETGRALYRSAISLMYEDRAAETVMHSEPECTLIFTMLSGEQTSLALYALNERHLEVARNGQTTGFYINKGGLGDIVSALEALY